MSISVSSPLRGRFVSSGSPQPLSIPGYTDIMLYNITNITANAAASVWWAKWTQGMPSGSALVGTSNVGPTDVLERYISSDGFSPIDTSVGLPGPAQIGTAISQAAAASVAMAGHTFRNGDIVRITNSTGMFQIDGMDFTVGNVVAGVSFDLINMDTSAFAAPATAVVGRYITNEPYFYPRRRFITKISQAANARVTMSVTHGLTVGQKVRMVVPSTFGMFQMNSILATIVAVGNADSAGSTNTIDLDVDSTAFGAFAFPASFANYFGQFAQVVPVGDAASTFDGATVNTAIRGLLVGSSVVGVAGDVIEWVAQRAVTI